MSATVIGPNPPAQSISRASIEQLPARDVSVWRAYLDRSEHKRQADKHYFATELKRSGPTILLEPPHGNSARNIPLDHEPSWYAGAEALHIAAVIVSFQTPAGG